MRKIAGVVMQRMNWKIDPREDEGAPADPASKYKSRSLALHSHTLDNAGRSSSEAEN
jgi:hypothetical protein